MANIATALLDEAVLSQWEWSDHSVGQLRKGLDLLNFTSEPIWREKRDLSQMPVVFIPEETETECVAENRMSSFGFLGFVVSAVNAVVNVANNINNNNNNRNNNNNDNNN